MSNNLTNVAKICTTANIIDVPYVNRTNLHTTHGAVVRAELENISVPFLRFEKFTGCLSF